MKHFLFFSLLFNLIFSNAYGDDRQQAEKLLKEVQFSSKVANRPLSQYPQNFGGDRKKIFNSEKATYTQVAVDLALADEKEFNSVVKEVVQPLERMILKKKIELGGIAGLQASFSVLIQNNSAARVIDGVSEFKWQNLNETLNLGPAEAYFNAYSNAFKAIDYLSIDPNSISVALSDRNTRTSLPQSYSFEAKFDIRGKTNHGLREDRGILWMKVKRDGKTNSWKITEFVMKSFETLSAVAPTFQESTELKKEQVSLYLRKEAIRRGGYALAINDLDQDGQLDLLVGHMGAMDIIKGHKDGSFRKVSNKSLGFEDETLVKSAVVADFNNDGKKDVLLVRFAPDEKTGSDIVFYQNQGSKFKKSQAIKNRVPAYYAMPSAVADYNGDGFLDFYVGFPGAKDFTVIGKSAGQVKGIKAPHPQGLFYNQYGESFEEVTKVKLPLSTKANPYQTGYPEVASIYPHSSMALDYDLDGDMDIVVIDDKANLSPLYRNTGSGVFEQVAEKIGLTNYDFGMGFTAADLDNDGTLEFVYSNVNFLPAERLHNSMVKNFSDYSHLPGTFGIRIFKSKDGKNYSDVTALTGITGAGYGIGGVEAIDYNNDGFMDLYVVNGLWSGTTKEQDLSSLFVRANAKMGFDFQEVLGSASGIAQANTSFMKILMGFQGDPEKMAWQENVRPSMAGFQRNCLFRNNGDGTFTEVGYLMGVDSQADGYVAAAADLNGDGNMDLVLRNAYPGIAENSYAPVQLFLNQNPNKQKSVQLSFVGHKSNRDGIGIIAEAKLGKQKIIRHLVANNGAIQAENVLHFGLGPANMLEDVTIRWPSGVVQNFKNIKAGRHVITEDSNNLITAMSN